MAKGMLPIKLKLPHGFLDEEEKDGYIVTTAMKRVWAVELDLLNELLKVCDKYHITIYANGGTMLGAARHKGMIPWDDDIDMMMFREDYERLCKVAPLEFLHPYFFQTEETDPGSYRGHAQLRNSETTGILQSEYIYHKNINQGIFIDIFPLDNVPDNQKEREEYLKETRRLYRKFIKYHYLSFPYHFKFRRNIIMLFANYMEHVITSRKKASIICDYYYSHLMKYTKKYNNVETKKITCAPFYSFLYEKIDFGTPVYLPFEMLEIPIVCNYEKVLKENYGDWRKFVIAPSLHGSVIFDTEKSYKEFLK